MLQFNPDMYWSVWQLVGMVISIPLVIYYLYSRKFWEDQEFKSDADALRYLRRYMIVIAIPFITAGLVDIVANIVVDPSSIEQILWHRGLVYYLGVLGGFVFVYFIFFWAMRETTNPWDKPEINSSLN